MRRPARAPVPPVLVLFALLGMAGTAPSAVRLTGRTMSFGIGGAIRLRAGHLDWVEFGGRRFDDLPVLFATEKHGTGGDRLRDGILGMDLMRHFRIVFDYSHRRIALFDTGEATGAVVAPPRR